MTSGSFAAEVVLVEPTGTETHVVRRHGGRDLMAVFRERHTFRPGEQVHLTPVGGMINLFDEASGDRLP